MTPKFFLGNPLFEWCVDSYQCQNVGQGQGQYTFDVEFQLARQCASFFQMLEMIYFSMSEFGSKL